MIDKDGQELGEPMKIYMARPLCDVFDIPYMEGSPVPFTANPKDILTCPFSNWDREHTDFLRRNVRAAMTLRLEAVRLTHDNGHTYHEPGWYIATPFSSPDRQEDVIG